MTAYAIYHCVNNIAVNSIYVLYTFFLFVFLLVHSFQYFVTLLYKFIGRNMMIKAKDLTAQHADYIPEVNS